MGEEEQNPGAAHPDTFPLSKTVPDVTCVCVTCDSKSEAALLSES